MSFVFSFGQSDTAKAFAAAVEKDFGLVVHFDVRFGDTGGAIIRVPPIASGHRLPGGEDLIDAGYRDQVETRWLARGANPADARAAARRAAIEHAIEELAAEYGGDELAE